MSWQRYRITLWLALLLAAVSSYWLARGILDTIRFDGSANALFTLSARDKFVARTISEPIDLTLITSMGGLNAQASPQIDRMDRYSRQVIVFLESLRRASHNKVRIHVLQAKTGSLAREWAQSAGIAPMRQGTEQAYYLGVVGRNSVDTEIVIPFLDPDSGPLLESQLIEMVRNLDNPNTKTIALITSFPDARELPGLRRDARDTQLAAQLARRYDVVRLDESFDDIPDPTNLLLILHPFSLSDRQLYLIDQFILAKGRALIFLDPLALRSFSPRGRPLFSGATRRSDLQPLLQNWGLTLSDQVLALGPDLDWSPQWANPQSSAKELGSAAKDFSSGLWQGSGYWRKKAPRSPSDGTTLRDLLLAPEGAMARAADFPALLKTENRASGPVGASSANPENSPPPSAYVIGVALDGKFSTAFPNGSPPRPRISGLNPDRAPLKNSQVSAQVRLFADADGLNPLNPNSENNAALLLKWVDSLLTGDDKGLTTRKASFRDPWKATRAQNVQPNASIQADRRRLETELAQWTHERQALEARGFGAVTAPAAPPASPHIAAGLPSLRIQSDADAQWTRKERARIVTLRNQERAIQRQLIALDRQESDQNMARQWPWILVSLGIVPGLLWIASLLLWIGQRPRRVSHGRL